MMTQNSAFSHEPGRGEILVDVGTLRNSDRRLFIRFQDLS